ncbi:MAG TPA: hypothetical protein DCS93_26215 [Microscillaceae bacterium]|nr:hypothetical protein [Microscillaceae bacterium]
MQSNHLPLAHATTPLKTLLGEAKPVQLEVFTQHLHYSIQRRLENVINLAQEALEVLLTPSPTQASRLENYVVLLEDATQLAQNDLALLEWLPSIAPNQ